MICKKCNKDLPVGAIWCCWCGAKQITERKARTRGNGQGSVYKLPNGTYRAAVTVATYSEDGKIKQKRITKNFKKKSDAVAALPSMALAERPKDITLHDLYALYINSKGYDELSQSQRDKMGYAWKRWSALEFRGIATLTVDDLQTQVDAKTSTYYPARDMKVIMSHLYNIALRKEIVQYNKTDHIDLPDSPKAKRECWTSAEMTAMWEDYVHHPFTAYPLIMCYAGLRYGELSSILIENIHLAEDYMIGGIKTEAGIDREIPIHQRIKPVIEKLITGSKKKLLEMNEDNFYAAYWSMVDRTGIRHLPPHTCRHYYFSSMTAAGVQGGIIAEVGGHANYLTTLKNYVRIPLQDKIDAVNKIE